MTVNIRLSETELFKDIVSLLREVISQLDGDSQALAMDQLSQIMINHQGGD